MLVFVLAACTCTAPQGVSAVQTATTPYIYPVYPRFGWALFLLLLGYFRLTWGYDFVRFLFFVRARARRFYPEVLLMCGSPVGMFLSLRESTLDTDSLFKFKTTTRFFNLFHVRKTALKASRVDGNPALTLAQSRDTLAFVLSQGNIPGSE